MSILDWFRQLFRPRQEPPPPPPGPSGEDPRLVSLINAFRTSHGLAAVSVHHSLAAAAAGHAADCEARGVLSHTGSNSSKVGFRIARCGYLYTECGECVAEGEMTPAECVAMWEKDPPHRRILLGDFVHVGTSRQGVMWVCDMARPIT